MADGGQDFNLGHVVGDTGPKGDKGDTGNGIQSIVLQSTSGKVKTYRITFTDGDYFDYQVTDGSDASVTIVSSWNSTTSNSKVPSEKLTKDSLDSKADTSSLSSVATSGSYNDLSNKPTIPTASTSTPSADTSSGSYGSGTSYARSNHSHPKSSLYAEATHSHTKSQITDFPSLSTVATSGSYSDLSNKPSIPSSSSDLSDGSDLIKKSSTTGLIKNNGTIDTNTYLTSSAIANMLTTSDIANNLTTTSSGKVLDARQGKALADLIGDAITYINQ